MSTPTRQTGRREGIRPRGQLNAPEGVFVTPQGAVWVADRGNGRIVQYTPDGRFVKALRKPRSRLLEEDQVYQPNKLVIDRRGYIYVLNGGGDYRGIFLLDANRNNVQVFRPTGYAQLVHQASKLYYDGRYEQAAEVWHEVLRRNSFLELAHTGLGKAAFRQGDYLTAMHEYRIARNKDGYSQAFGEWRHEFLREHFGWVFPLLIFGAWVLSATTRQTIRRLMTMRPDFEGSPA